MTDFMTFRSAVNTQIDKMVQHELYTVECDKYEMFDLYLDSFPAGTNEIFRKRREYDCQCCKQFIRAFGNVVAIIDGKVESMWHCDAEGKFANVCASMTAYIESKEIKNVFRHDQAIMGTDSNYDNETITKWNHFYYKLPNKFVQRDSGTFLSNARSSRDVFKRSLEEITMDSINTVIELIAQNSLYRGEEHKFAVTDFRKHKVKYGKLNGVEKELFIWNTSLPDSVKRMRNTAIGTLLVDISEGKKNLEGAVKSFELKVAPSNYKRTTALITKGMIQKAQQKLSDIGLEDAIERRCATVGDLTINNIRYADRSTKAAMSVFDEMIEEAATLPKNLDKVEEITIDKFMADVVPTAKKIEAMVENIHESNFMTLIAPTFDSNPMFKWNNRFSWNYNGEVADSMRERVIEAGGRVDGVLRFTHSWNHRDGNNSLMDLHVFMPTSSYVHSDKKQVNNSYPSGQRVGWNNRNDRKSGGVQDVDYVSHAPAGYIPIENITFPSVSRMPEGDYYLKIHNWEKRSRNKEGFKAEVEIDGIVYQYNYEKPLDHKEWVDVAKVTLKNGKFTIEHLLPESKESKEIWGVNTNVFKNVSMILNSPNHWDGNETGNKHMFFILDGCKTDEPARGFYNEFLRADLNEHRKVFEVLASKTKVEPTDDQLSGVGFSSTVRNHMYVRVTGKFSRIVKILF